jgi:hypothetical protein
VQLAGPAVDDYASRIAELLERYGVVLTKPGPGEPVEVLEADDRSLSFELLGALPDGREPGVSTVEMRERFRATDVDLYERDGYEYELIDRERSFRRAFHLHDRDWFERRYLVVVHEHCEQPLADPACEHYQSMPLRDGYAGVAALIDAWTGEPDCSNLHCLE